MLCPALQEGESLCKQIEALRLQDAVQRLKKGKDGLQAHLALQDKYFRNIAELTGKWNIRPNVNFETGGSAAPFIANLAIPGADVSSEAVTQIELGRSSTGAVEVDFPFVA